MTDDIMLKLGNFKFTIDTLSYTDLSSTLKLRWQEATRIGKLSCLQYTGFDNPIISLNGILYPSITGGMEELNLFKNEAIKGKPLMLVDGLGKVHGYWCITDINNKQSYFASNGFAQKISFTIGLKYYGKRL